MIHNGFRLFFVKREDTLCPTIIHADRCDDFFKIMDGADIFETKRGPVWPPNGGQSKPDQTALFLMCKFANIENDVIVNTAMVRSAGNFVNISGKAMNAVRLWLIYFGCDVGELDYKADRISCAYQFVLKPLELIKVGRDQ